MPPHTTISLPVQTAVCEDRGSGMLYVLVGVQLSAPGAYLPPEFKSPPKGTPPVPPQMIISLPVHTAVCRSRGSGALEVFVAVQLSVPGLYLPPVSKGCEKLWPPQMIISLPARTAVCCSRASGASSPACRPGKPGLLRI